MAMESLPKIVAASLVSLFLAGCGGSFVPATAGQSGGSMNAFEASHATVTRFAVPGSISAHPTTISDQSTPAPAATPGRQSDSVSKAHQKSSPSRESVSAHPTGVNDDNDAAPKPTATPKF